MILNEHFATISVNLAFFVHWGKHLFDSLHKVQVAVAPKLGALMPSRHPQLLSVYSQLIPQLAHWNYRSTHGPLGDQIVEALPNKDRGVCNRTFKRGRASGSRQSSKVLASVALCQTCKCKSVSCTLSCKMRRAWATT